MRRATPIPAPIVNAASRKTRTSALALVRKLLFFEALGHGRVSTAGYRPVYHCARQGQWVASVLVIIRGYRLERWRRRPLTTYSNHLRGLPLTAQSGRAAVR